MCRFLDMNEFGDSSTGKFLDMESGDFSIGNLELSRKAIGKFFVKGSGDSLMGKLEVLRQGI